ncbi:hypothetical protein [Edwardsiella piscicida]|uniref:hypothetical protein n=1 Tax=Edwardsiella piscicida TaxID=1263550 RepID=UPI000D50DDBC|nr:hypothetical protein [Edwardsiella piscicida]UCQ42999.1 hypothetical protein DCF39_09335 [Edwardsiella piscicida]
MNMREEFEKWFKEKFEVPDFVFSDFDESAGEYNYTDETEELYINITMMFEAWKAAQPKWIDRDGYNPIDSKWYVVSTEYGYYTQCWSDGDGWLGDDVSIPDDDVCYLIPLPSHAES